MIYPDFTELVNLRAKVTNRKILSNRLVKSVISGNYFSPFRGQGLEFEEVRKYVPGDDVRKIDWRVTARSGIPHIKLFTEERERNVLICLDLNHTMRFGTRGTFKSIQAARVFALLGWCASVNSNMVGGCLFGDVPGGRQFYKPSRRRSSFLKMLADICQKPVQEPAIDFSIESAIDFTSKITSHGSLVFVISDFMHFSDELVENLRNLNTHSQLILVSINDPADINIAAFGNILFNNGPVDRYINSADNEPNYNNGSLLANTRNKDLQDNYHRLWLENYQKLQSTLASYGIFHIPLKTNQDVYFDLFLGLKNAGKVKRR